ncbi:MAG: DUF3592 domain-containing protein [Planctomycetota bacterium]
MGIRPGTSRKGGAATRRGMSGRVAACLFFGLFFAAGAGFGWFVTLKPAWAVWQARGWDPVTLTITSSRLDVSTDSDGSSYRVEVEYRYTVSGRTYTGDTHDFYAFIGTDGRSGKQKIVDALPPGTTVTGYVDPNDPTRAVIHRGFTATAWFGLLPMVFVLVGLGGMFGTWFWGGRKRWATRHAKTLDADEADHWLPELARGDADDGGVGERKRGGSETVSPTKSRWGGVVFLTLFGLVWNGFSWPVFIFAWRDGEVILGLFMSVFVLVGIGVFAAWVYTAMGLLNPVVRLTFDPRVVERGQTLELGWDIAGRAGRIAKLTISVEAVERATYRRGTDTITDEHTIYDHVLVEAGGSDGRDPLARDGRVEHEVPAGVMHSLDAPNNKVVWRVRVRGDIPRWPDMNDTYDFAVVPAGMGGPRRRGMF